MNTVKGEIKKMIKEIRKIKAEIEYIKQEGGRGKLKPAPTGRRRLTGGLGIGAV
jgi:hypothetical protein